MSIDFRQVRNLLQGFDFAKVFAEAPGGSRPRRAGRWVPFRAAEGDFERRLIAETSGVAVLEVRAAGGGAVPVAEGRAAVHEAIAALHPEHVLVFVDGRHREQSVWSWRAPSRASSTLELRGAADLAVLDKLLRHPTLGDDVKDAWTVELGLGMHLDPGDERFVERSTAHPVPVYAGDAISSYMWYPDRPRFWTEEHPEVHRRGVREKFELSNYILGIRNAVYRTEGRTLNATVIPPGILVNDTVTLLQLRPETTGKRSNRKSHVTVLLYVLALLNSYVLDWYIRLRPSRRILVNDIHQSPMPRLAPKDPRVRPIALRAAKLTCTTPEFDALAKDVGLDSHAQGVTHPEQRARLRAELEGLIAHLYGLTEHDLVHVLRSFPLAPEPQRVAAHNAYRDVARGTLP